MAILTKEERAWVRKLQAVLINCPSKRIAFATTGDCDVTLFDNNRYNDICDAVDDGNGEFIPSAEKIGATFELVLTFPNQVESTAG